MLLAQALHHWTHGNEFTNRNTATTWTSSDNQVLEKIQKKIDIGDFHLTTPSVSKSRNLFKNGQPPRTARAWKISSYGTSAWPV